MRNKLKQFFKNSSIENIYQLNGKVPLLKAIPFGLQHVLAMFVANITPIIIIISASGAKLIDGTPLGTKDMATLIQCSMLIAGIGTLIQLYPLWRIGSRLPIVMGVSFTFVGALIYITTTSGYEVALGAIIIGGIFEGLLGLTYKYWKKIVAPIVAACVVTAIGFSLLPIGAKSFGGGYVPDFGASKYLIVGTITLFSSILFNVFSKGHKKALSILFGLIVGYIAAAGYQMIDFAKFKNTVESSGVIALPTMFKYKPKFEINSIISVAIIFLVSAAETIGDTSAIVSSGLGREVTDKEISGSLACDGFASSLSGMFGCAPITSFSQNVGLVGMTKVVNRFTIMTGAVTLILASLVPPIGALFATIPDAVLGGCTIMMFGTIVVSGMSMIGKCKFNQRNTIISALSIGVGIGFTQVPGLFRETPKLFQDIFATNPVAWVFVIAVVLNLVLPKNMGEENDKNKKSMSFKDRFKEIFKTKESKKEVNQSTDGNKEEDKIIEGK